MCCQATKPCMGSWTCNLLKLAQALSGTPPGRAAVYGAGPLAGRLGWLSRPGRAPTKWDVAHSLDARPHLSTLHHCGPIVQWRVVARRASSINRQIQSTSLYKVGLSAAETQPLPMPCRRAPGTKPPSITPPSTPPTPRHARWTKPQYVVEYVADYVFYDQVST